MPCFPAREAGSAQSGMQAMFKVPVCWFSLIFLLPMPDSGV